MKEKIAGIVSKIVPSGKFKEFLKKIYYSHNEYNNFDVSVIKNSLICADGTVSIELNNGLKIFGYPNYSKFLDYKWEYTKNKKIRKKINKKAIKLIDRLFVSYENYEKFYKIKPGDIVIDIGAHIGCFTIRASKKVGRDGKVIAIEPQQQNIKILEKNIKENNLENVVVIDKGVWSKKEEKKLFISPNTGGHSFFKRTEHVNLIKTDLLDNILSNLKIDKVNFIKMDIEGAEIEALKGMEKTLEEPLNMAIAAYHQINGQKTYKTIDPILREKGFKISKENGIDGEIIYASKI